jgi:hypothetical protein
MIDGWIILILVLATVFFLFGLAVLFWTIRVGKMDAQEFKRNIEWPGKMLFGKDYQLSIVPPWVQKAWVWVFRIILILFVLGCLKAIISIIQVFIL